MKIKLELAELFETLGSNDEATCQDCAGRCCKAGVTLPLSSSEAEQMAERGTELRTVPRSEWGRFTPGWRRKFYEFMGDCANLDTDNKCTIYDERPAACREFPVGGLSCQKISKQPLRPIPPDVI